MKYNLKSLIYSFFTLIGLIHAVQLIGWYTLIMDDYNQVYKKIDSSFKTNLKQQILIAADFCNNESHQLSKNCDECSKILRSEVSDRILGAQIIVNNQRPIFLEIIWSSEVGLIKKRFTDFDITKDFEKICNKDNIQSQKDNHEK